MFKKCLEKVMQSSSTEPDTARLDGYIRKAWTKDPSVKPFSTQEEGGAPPTLRRDRKNRIIYYIGSFNPPHQGHVALLDHIYQHSRDPSGFNAVAVLVMAHGESWRRRLLEDGLGDERRRWLWVLPRDVNAWWVFQTKLADACAEDGFALEFHELLGPDYVGVGKPHCHGWHGVVTSNICRAADFDVGGDHSLLKMAEFQPWEKEQRQKKDQGQGQERTKEEIRATAEEAEDDNEVWMCHKQVEGHDYSIRYIRAKQPTLDPDMSSTKMRNIIAASPPDALAENLRGIALNPELLIQDMQETAE
ncbi:hypothetical protein PG994_002409 [Apiospora phragmitis]|uniref:Cytidyltransferase-like domain-containing protein n=1 Tax=Apiospora phragmitis TaxID=2905665 RepID=A0ABR1WWC2_9PEZI